jgi:hypothetical protein
MMMTLREFIDLTLEAGLSRFSRSTGGFVRLSADEFAGRWPHQYDESAAQFGEGIGAITFGEWNDIPFVDARGPNGQVTYTWDADGRVIGMDDDWYEELDHFVSNQCAR